MIQSAKRNVRALVYLAKAKGIKHLVFSPGSRNAPLIIGFTNDPFSAIVTPGITSIEQHSEKIGELAANTFLRRIAHPEEKVTLNKMILTPELIVRASSLKKTTKKHLI